MCCDIARISNFSDGIGDIYRKSSDAVFYLGIREQNRTWAGVLQNAPTISPYCLNSQHATAAAAPTLGEATQWCMGMRTV